MSEKAKFSAEDEEKIIKFVKLNEILYNVKHEIFYDTKAKNLEVVKTKWQTMRDYFIRSKEIKTNGSAGLALSKRNESLSFLLQTSQLTHQQTQSEGDSDGTNSYVDDETYEIIRDFLANRRKPSYFIPETMDDDIDYFFKSLALTVCKFPPATIARIKFKMAQIIGEEIAYVSMPCNNKSLKSTSNISTPTPTALWSLTPHYDEYPYSIKRFLSKNE